MKREKSISIDARMANHSGIGVYINCLIEELRDEFNWFIIKDSSDDFVNFQGVTVSSKIYSISEQFHLCWKSSSSDLFWSPHYNVPLLPVRSKKRVVTIHDVYHLAFSSSLSLVKKVYANLLLKAAVRLSDRIITVSDFSKKEIVKYTGCNPSKIDVIYNGVRKRTQILEFDYIKAKYKLGNKKYLLFVGNVKPHKNLISFLKALKQIASETIDQYDIVIVGRKEGMITGDSDLFAWLDSEKELSKKVFFTGLVDQCDLDTIYTNASLLVFPSVYEGFGLPPLEAMLNDCPVVASNCTSIPEVCGSAALYFDPYSIDEIASVVTTVLKNSEIANELRSFGRERIKLFSWENSAAEHQKIFNELVSDTK